MILKLFDKAQDPYPIKYRRNRAGDWHHFSLDLINEKRKKKKNSFKLCYFIYLTSLTQIGSYESDQHIEFPHIIQDS